MIVSASYRTDIPAFYGEWFRRRLEAGHAMVANPYGGPPYRVSLAPPALQGFVFWSRNTAPFRPVLERLAARRLPFVVQYTLTGYPRTVEQAVPPVEAGLRQMRELAVRHGPRAVVWRYDPLLFAAGMDSAFHRRAFAALARELRGVVDEAVVSFAQLYAKTRRNLNAAAGARRFEWRDPEAYEKRALLLMLAEIAGEHEMRLTVCSQPELGGEPARCIDAGRLSDLAGQPLEVRQKGNRPGCRCAESRDVGAYDSCPHGCIYCYAVGSRARALARLKGHDPSGEFLLPPGVPDQASAGGVSSDAASGGASGALATATMAGRSRRS